MTEEKLRKMLESKLPPPKERRPKRVMTAWSEKEYEVLQELAVQRNQPVASLVHDLAWVAVEALRESNQKSKPPMIY